MPQTMREAILSELEYREWTAYRLIQELNGKLNPQSVYDFIAGRSDLKVSSMEVIIEALNMRLRHVGTHVETATKKT